MLGLDVDGQHPGDHLKRANGSAVPFRVSLRSPVAVDHRELVQNGAVIRAFDLGRDHRHFDAEGTLDLGLSGWLLLRAWNNGADPIILDIYPYASTNPIDIELPTVPGRPQRCRLLRRLDGSRESKPSVRAMTATTHRKRRIP